MKDEKHVLKAFREKISKYKQTACKEIKPGPPQGGCVLEDKSLPRLKRKYLECRILYLLKQFSKGFGQTKAVFRQLKT